MTDNRVDMVATDLHIQYPKTTWTFAGGALHGAKGRDHLLNRPIWTQKGGYL